MGESVELTLILFVELEKNFIGKIFLLGPPVSGK